MAKSVLEALKATGAADLQAAIDAVSANMFKIKETKLSACFPAAKRPETGFRHGMQTRKKA